MAKVTRSALAELEDGLMKLDQRPLSILERYIDIVIEKRFKERMREFTHDMLMIDKRAEKALAHFEEFKDSIDPEHTYYLKMLKSSIKEVKDHEAEAKKIIDIYHRHESSAKYMQRRLKFLESKLIAIKVETKEHKKAVQKNKKVDDSYVREPGLRSRAIQRVDLYDGFDSLTEDEAVNLVGRV